MKRTLLTVAATLMLAATLVAQRGPGPGLNGGQRPDRTAALKNALGLTDAQVTAIQALDALLNAASNPTDVGNAAIALHAAESKISGERDYFISELKKLLTGDQQQKLDTLLAANGGRGLPFPGLGGFGPRGGRSGRQ